MWRRTCSVKGVRGKAIRKKKNRGFPLRLPDTAALPLCSCFDLSQRCPLTSIWSWSPRQAATCDLCEPAVARLRNGGCCLTLGPLHWKQGFCWNAVCKPRKVSVMILAVVKRPKFIPSPSCCWSLLQHISCVPNHKVLFVYYGALHLLCGALISPWVVLFPNGTLPLCTYLWFTPDAFRYGRATSSIRPAAPAGGVRTGVAKNSEYELKNSHKTPW